MVTLRGADLNIDVSEVRPHDVKRVLAPLVSLHLFSGKPRVEILDRRPLGTSVGTVGVRQIFSRSTGVSP